MTPTRQPGDLGPRRGWLGVELQATGAREPGVRIRSVIPDSPAERAGIIAGDVVLGIEGQTMQSPGQLVRSVGERMSGERIAVSIKRGGTHRLLSAQLSDRPDLTEVQRMRYVGAPAPAWLGLRPVQGVMPLRLGALRGKVVVVEFWSPWCVVCRLLVPTLNDWHDQFGAQGVAVLGITAEPVAETVHAAQQLGIEYPVASDADGKTTAAYRAMALPTVFLIDRVGTVREVMVGYTPEQVDGIRAAIERLLAGQPSGS